MPFTPTRFLTFFLILSFLVISLTPFLPAQAAPNMQPFVFTPAACMFDLPIDAIEGEDVQCGYLTVPLEHANPSGPTIELAVAIIKSRDPSPKPDPLFMAQGGPGGSTIYTYAEQLLSSSRLRADRDIVLFDQRGTLYSRPALTCNEIDQLTIDYLDQDLSPEESLRLELEAMQKCHTRLANEAIDLSAFDSLENAADIEALRLALGYEKINLYGVSYGTLLALHYMRLYPQGLRSVILDAVVPPQTNYILNAAQTTDRSFKLLFNACASDPNCDKAYPDLEKVFFELVDHLDAHPVHVEMTDTETGSTYEALIDGESFASGLFQILYISSLIPALPRMIYDARAGDFDFFARILSIIIFDRSMAYGMYYSVICAEDADYRPEDQDLSGVHPKIAEIEGRGPSEFLQVCQLWKVEPLDSSVDQPVTSEIPTLVLSGEFDPITPPYYGEQVAATLGRSYQYVFPAGGHGQAMEGECQDNLILAFLDDPYTAPDAACIAEQGLPKFYTHENLIDMPVILGLLNLKAMPSVQFLILLLMLLALLSADVLLPLAWLIRRLRRKPTPVTAPMPGVETPYTLPGNETHGQPLPILVRAASWLAFFSGPLLLAFLVGLAFVIGTMFSDNDNRLFFGVTADARLLFLIPLLFALLSVGMLIANIQAWLRRAWSLWRRLYFTILALSAMTATLILTLWGALTAFF